MSVTPGGPSFYSSTDMQNFNTSGSGDFVINCTGALNNLVATQNNCMLIYGVFMQTSSPSVVGLIVASVINKNIFNAVFIGANGGSFQVSGTTTTTISMASTYSSPKSTFISRPIILG